MRRSFPVLLLVAGVVGCAGDGPFRAGRPVVSPDDATTLDTLTVTLPSVQSGDFAEDELSVRWEVDGDEVVKGWTLEAGTPRGASVVALVTWLQNGATELTEPLIIANSAPVLSVVGLTPAAPDGDDDLLFSVTVDDADDDDVTLTYAWDVNGTAAAADGDTLTGDAFEGGDTVTVTVTADDGAGGVGTATKTVVIANTPPTAPRIETYPEDPYAGEQNLVCRVLVASTDLDGGEPTYTIRWTVDGQAWSGAALDTLIPGDTVPASVLSADQAWHCTAVADDGDLLSVEATSSAVTVRAREIAEVAVAAGATCRVFDDGSVNCLGDATGERFPTNLAQAWSTVEMSPQWTCGLNAGSRLVCIGVGDAGLDSEPTGLFDDLAVLDGAGVGVRRDGTLVRWGGTDVAYDPPTGEFVAVAAGGDGFCALGADDRVTCWGGLAASVIAEVPDATFTRVAVAQAHACGVTTEGELLCWGDDAIDPPAGTAWVDVTSTHCARDQAGDVTCWDASLPEAPTATFATLTAAADVTCGVTTDGDVRCWGGDLSVLAWADTPGPARAVRHVADTVCFDTYADGWVCLPDARVDGVDLAGAVDLGLGEDVACTLDATGALDCVVDGASPEIVPPASGTYTSLVQGETTGCALDAAGAPVCWSQDGSAAATPPGGLALSMLAIDAGPACGLDMAGHPVCWGGLDDAPVADAFSTLAVDPVSACGVRDDGTLACWGAGWGDEAPVGTYTTVAGGGEAWCGVRVSGDLNCWFDAAQPDPRYEGWPRSGEWLSMTGRAGTVCAVSLEGRVACWGVLTR